ncbi:MAG: site-2 protease family protein [Acutalibacteraceae bacterium]|nr:site-2 protease family protein [Clostridiales bacterium]
MLMQLLRGGWSLPNILMTILVYAVLLLVVFPVHEMAHGFAAYLLGDKTAKYQGRLTMNPLAHMDPFGSLMMLLVGVGYAKPVPVNPYNFKNRKAGMALTALAGPLSNLLMAILSVGLYRVLIIFVSDGWTLTLLRMGLVELFASINISLAMFNLLPIPPLDGFRIISYVLPDKWVFMVNRYQQVITLVVLVVVFTGILDVPLNFLHNAVYGLILRMFGFHLVMI